jgi:hypothetical protein
MVMTNSWFSLARPSALQLGDDVLVCCAHLRTFRQSKHSPSLPERTMASSAQHTIDVNGKFFLHKTTPSDINEHLGTLYEYAKECERVAECGMRSVVSTWSFIKGLIENKSSIKQLISVDLNYSPNIAEAKQACAENKVDFSFVMGDDTKITLPEVDLLFIDTWHIYGHLKRELDLHHSKVAKYIVMHDTTVDEWEGETIRCSWDAEAQSRTSGYPVEDIKKGLWPAIEEFLVAHPEWTMHKRFTNNNGLTILKRTPSPAAASTTTPVASSS